MIAFEGRGHTEPDVFTHRTILMVIVLFGLVLGSYSSVLVAHAPGFHLLLVEGLFSDWPFVPESNLIPPHCGSMDPQSPPL